MAGSEDESEQVLVKVLPLELEVTAKKRKGNGTKIQRTQEHVEVANRKRVVSRTKRTMLKKEGEKRIEKQDINQSDEKQIGKHQKDAKPSKEKRSDEAAAKEDKNDRNQKVESQLDEHEEVEGYSDPTHKEENHSDEKGNDYDTNNQDQRVLRLDGQSQVSTTRTRETQNKNSVSGHGLFAHAVSTVTKLQSWWKGGKAVAWHTEPAAKGSNQDDKSPDDEHQEDENQVDKNHDDDNHNDEDQERPFQTSQLIDEEPQQKEDLTPVALPGTPPSSPVAYRPTPAAFSHPTPAVYDSTPAVFFPPAQSSISDDEEDDDEYLSKVFQVGQQSKEDLEQQANDVPQDDEKQVDEIENEAKQDRVNRKTELRHVVYHRTGQPPSSTLPVPITSAPRTAALAFHPKRKRTPPPGYHETKGPDSKTPFTVPSGHMRNLHPLWTAETQPQDSSAVVFAGGEGQNAKIPVSAKEEKAEAEQEPEPESDPEDRFPLTEDQMWEEMDKALRKIEEKKKKKKKKKKKQNKK